MSAEAQRQQALMAAILQRDDGASLQPQLAARPAGVRRGLQAYQANAGASAERSLAASFPTVQALVGEDSFAALARAFWHALPPRRGDLAWFGDELPAFIASSEQLADVPFLADVARLEWQLALAERAADGEVEVDSLQQLAEHAPSQLCLRLAPHVALIDSAHPIVSLWAAHRRTGDAALQRAAVREILSSNGGEAALVWRAGWRGEARAVEPAVSRWVAALLHGLPLDRALAQAGEGFAFEAWLADALAAGWIQRVDHAG
jgi:hypothetical protein